MARNGAGLYNLPAGNPVVSGTTVSSTWANITMNDISAEITNSLPRDGTAPMTSIFKIVDGTAASPGLCFNTETASGLYRNGAADLGLSINGARQSQWTSTGLNATNLGATTPGTASVTTLNASGATALASTLAVTGAATLSSTLAVTGTTTLTGATSHGSTMSVAGATTLSSTLGVTGNTNLGAALTVSGNTITAGSVSVGTTLGVSGNLTGSTASFSSTITAPNFTGTASAATLAAKASTVASGGGNGTAMTFSWSGQGGQPTWLWGGNDGVNMYVYNPSNFSVNYATSCGTASNANAVNGISGWTYSNSGANPAYIWCTDGAGTYQHLTQPGALSVNYANSAGTSGSCSGNAATCTTASNSNALGGAGIGYFVNNGSSAVQNVTNTGASFLNSAIAGFGTVSWSVSVSDERLKENIVPSTEDSLSKINAIKFKSFNFKEVDGFVVDDGHTHEHGVIAQQVESVNPLWVNNHGTYKQIETQTMLYSALKAIQQLSERIEALEARE